MRFLRDAKWTAASDSYLAAKLRAAGFVFLGRTNTPELAILPTTEPEAYGATRSPWNTDFSAGGSSGGAAAAVAAGIVPAAHASDGGGSIRIPASCCGVFGLKPTRGRGPGGPPSFDAWAGLSIHHVVSRSVRDSALLLDASHGAEPGDPYAAPPRRGPYRDEVGADPGPLRVGLQTGSFQPVEIHPDCAEAARRAAKLCESFLHHIQLHHLHHLRHMH